MRKLFSAILVAALLIAGTSALRAAPALAATDMYTDIGGHWAKAAIERWSALGVLKGNDGKFRPDDPISRAELCAVLNRVIKFPATTWNGYTDVAPGKWYYTDVTSLGYQDALLTKSGGVARDGEIFPSEFVTREEAAATISRAFGLPRKNFNGDRKEVFGFSDADKISASLADDILGLVELHIVNGNADGTFAPKGQFTRAQIVTILDNAVDSIADKPGTYSSPLGKRVLVVADDVRFENQDCDYMIIAASACMNGNVTIDSANHKSWPMYGWSAYGAGHTVSWMTSNLSERALKGDSYFRSLKLDETEFAGGFPKQTVVSGFAGGDGTAEKPYLITSQAELDNMRYYMSAKFKDLHFALANDITLSGAFMPLGASFGEYPAGMFSAVFDGNNHTVSGLDINIDGADYASVGFFANLWGGAVENLTVKGRINVKMPNGYTAPVTDEGRAKTGVFVGGIAGDTYSQTTLTNCHAEVDITVTGSPKVIAGGLVGDLLPGSVTKDCSAAGTIRATGPKAQNASFELAVGGLAGRLGGNMENCHSSAKTFSSGGYFSGSAGLVAHVVVSDDSKTRPTIKNCYATGDAHAEGAWFQNDGGGAFGQIKNATVESCFASGNVSVGNYEGAINVAGGFATGAYGGGVIKNCYATGNVTEYGSWQSMIGALTGRLEGEVINSYGVGNCAAYASKGDVKPADGSHIVIGSRRGEGGKVTQTADFREDGIFFVNETTGFGSTTFDEITAAQSREKSAYAARGWNFTDVWTFADGGAYKLPILRGIPLDVQKNLPLPKYLPAGT